MSGRHLYAEAAAILRVEERWLRRNISWLPHSKKGRTVTFSDADLARIDELTHVQADQAAVAAVAPAVLKPLPARRRRAS